MRRVTASTISPTLEDTGFVSASDPQRQVLKVRSSEDRTEPQNQRQIDVIRGSRNDDRRERSPITQNDLGRTGLLHDVGVGQSEPVVSDERARAHGVTLGDKHHRRSDLLKQGLHLGFDHAQGIILGRRGRWQHQQQCNGDPK